LSTYETPTASQAGNGSTAEQAKDKAKDAAGQARRGVRDQVDTRSTDAGRRVGGMAQDARSVSDELRKQGKDQPAKLVEQAADRAESLGSYLERSDGDTILRDVEDFGRRQPWTVIVGGLALGFAASRLMKASSDRRSTARWDDAPAQRGSGAQPVLPARTGAVGAGNLGGGPV
jgi:hypothetical protein